MARKKEGIPDAGDLRWLVERACDRLGVDAVKALSAIELEDDGDADVKWSVRNALRPERPLTRNEARKLLRRLVEVCEVNGWGVGPRIAIPMLRWHASLFGRIEPAALLLYPGESKRATEDLAAHIEAQLEHHDKRGRAWLQYGDAITKALVDYFERYERLSAPLLRVRGQPKNLYSPVRTSRGKMIERQMLLPRCRDRHPAAAQTGFEIHIVPDDRLMTRKGKNRTRSTE